ncbi:Nucleotide-binding universal stress protein, UspA family [Marinobacter daqiaonensis]|uniref:Nucleotide-binding universal stress protein, UspA family n=1 Tax=Marinobacter daqiaonensis TaxID=650891 RepID=A0A1I6GQP5_9GAMM|nr:universal stress protein [Marinobacter daqiaonensis]SFR44552.1 Nucleotide-binding universal stress protein, UspA family [Marinobacter daqiaonensis]
MYRKLLIAIDPEDDGEGERALKVAMDLLDEKGEMHLASVYNPDGGGFFPHVSGEAPEEKETEVKELLDGLVEKYLPPGWDVCQHVVAGSAGKKLVDLAGQLCADLMLLVSRGSSDRWRLRRATVEYVAVSAPCPVLVLPSLEKSGQETGEKREQREKRGEPDS